MIGVRGLKFIKEEKLQSFGILCCSPVTKYCMHRMKSIEKAIVVAMVTAFCLLLCTGVGFGLILMKG